MEAELQRLRKERDLYVGLLKLNAHTAPKAFLESALELIVDAAGAEQGYLEVFSEEGDEASWWSAAGCSDEDVETIRRRVSRGIVAEAVASGRVVLTPSAVLDPRFNARASVRESKIDAVLCAPIGTETPLGVLYLHTSGVFAEEEKARAEFFAQQLAPLAEHVFLSQRTLPDLTAKLRLQLKVDSIVGRSRALSQVLEDVAALARLDVGVLLTGETGTGKSQIARAIHENSARASGPLVELNCAAIPEQLLESELFGALQGSHATATRRLEGKVAAAQGGTLVLDEVGELALGSQAKLLQLLQDKEYFPLGASRPVAANARVLATTNVDLKQAVAKGVFRRDLFYRLQVVSLRVPSLKERPEDIRLLAEHFCAQACQRHRLGALRVSSATLRALEASEWPGNVRELSHALEAAAIRAHGRGASELQVTHLYPDGPLPVTPGGHSTFQEETRRFQAELITRALLATDWNVSAAARNLDVTRAHLYNLIHTYGIART
jgi:Nif-specific regulatory protein